MLVQPWNLFEIIVPALLIVGGILASIVGILVVDYYLIRKRRVNVTALYEENGQYHYWHGLNIAGFYLGLLVELSHSYFRTIRF